MAGEYSNNKYYRRRINPGDVTIEGRASNGMTLDNTGNVFLYSSQNQNITNQLTSSNYDGAIEISPNTDNSFIGIISTSTDSLISNSPINIQMGSTNYTTFNLENNSSNYIVTNPTGALPTQALTQSSVLPNEEPSNEEVLEKIKTVIPQFNPDEFEDLIIYQLPEDEDLESIQLSDVDNPYYQEFFASQAYIESISADQELNILSTPTTPISTFKLTSEQEKEAQSALNDISSFTYNPRITSGGTGAGAGCKRSGRVAMTKNEYIYYMKKLLETANIPINQYTLIFMLAWREQEGACALYNAFNSTQPTGCVKDNSGNCISLNKAKVTDYTSFENGINANAGLWKSSRYAPIVAALKTASSYQDLFNLITSQSDGPSNGAFYVWSQGFYKERSRCCGSGCSRNPNCCNKYKCPAPTNVNNYIAPIIERWINAGKITITNAIFKKS